MEGEDETGQGFLGVVLSLINHSICIGAVFAIVAYFRLLFSPPSLRADFSVWGIFLMGAGFGFLVTLSLTIFGSLTRSRRS